MNTRFDNFRSILRECFSVEYSEVPTDEESIKYSFSKRFTKRTEKLIKRQINFYWCIINRFWKKVLIFVLLLVLLFSVVLYFGIGYDTYMQDSGHLSSNHNYNQENTDIEPVFESDLILDDDGNIIGEIFGDKKASIFNSMLNSFYYFNEAYLRFELSLPYAAYGHITEIECSVDLKNAVSEEKVFENGELVSFSYSDGKSLTVRSIDYNEFNKDTYPVFSKENEKYVILSERMYTDGYGDIKFVYKNNVANCPSAKYSLIPQELAFKYLRNFKNREIYDSNMVVFGRHCVGIRGKESDEDFLFIVDSATGILLNYEIAENGIVTEYMNVKECKIDEGVAIFIEENLEEYIEEDK